MRTVIFANHHTNERVVCQVGLLEEVRGLMGALNIKLGGSWVYIQELKPYEAIPFTAAKAYHGFDNNPENDYCGNIINLKEPIRQDPKQSFNNNHGDKLDEKGFVFKGTDGKIYLCRMNGDQPWFYYWHPGNDWVTLKAVGQSEVWAAHKQIMEPTPGSIYHQKAGI